MTLARRADYGSESRPPRGLRGMWTRHTAATATIEPPHWPDDCQRAYRTPNSRSARANQARARTLSQVPALRADATERAEVRIMAPSGRSLVSIASTQSASTLPHVPAFSPPAASSARTSGGRSSCLPMAPTIADDAHRAVAGLSSVIPPRSGHRDLPMSKLHIEPRHRRRDVARMGGWRK